MSDSAKKYTIAVIPGDGIGKEVTPWAQKALEKAAEGVAEFDYENFDLGAERYLRDGAILPEEEEERIKKTDAILLGAVGDPRIKAGILERACCSSSVSISTSTSTCVRPSCTRA